MHAVTFEITGRSRTTSETPALSSKFIDGSPFSIRRARCGPAHVSVLETAPATLGRTI